MAMLKLYSLHRQAFDRPWITNLLVHCEGSAEEQAAANAAAVAAVLRMQGVKARWELHYIEDLTELPAGLSWDAPHWTDGAARAWGWHERGPQRGNGG